MLPYKHTYGSALHLVSGWFTETGLNLPDLNPEYIRAEKDTEESDGDELTSSVRPSPADGSGFLKHTVKIIRAEERIRNIKKNPLGVKRYWLPLSSTF